MLIVMLNLMVRLFGGLHDEQAANLLDLGLQSHPFERLGISDA